MKNRYLQSLAVLQILFCILSPKFIVAQGIDSLKTLGEVVITGSKITIAKKLVPLAITQINSKDITNSGEINILPVLNQFTPSIFVTERGILGFGVAMGSAGSINIRGIGGSPNTNVLVLIDGHPQFMGIFGHPLSDAYVASNVEKVEVLRGPASVLYGTNAMGGVINILTRQKREEGFTGNLQASYGSYQTQQYNVSSEFRKGMLTVFGGFNYDRTNGVRENSDFEIKNTYFKFTYQIHPHWRIKTDFALADFQANDNGPEFAPSPFGIDITRGKTALMVENQTSKLEGAFKFYYNFGQHDLTSGFISQDHHTGFDMNQSYKFGKSSAFTLGFDYKNFGGKANQGAAMDETKAINELGIYGFWKQSIGQKFTVNIGLRNDNNQVFGNQVSPFAGLTLSPWESTTFKANMTRGFRSPTVNELFVFLPNPNLQPVSLWNYEFTYEQVLWENWRSEITIFRSEGSNFLQVVPGINGLPTRQNVGVFQNQGIELVTKVKVLPNFSLGANYSYINYQNPTLAAPKQQLNLNANYTLGMFSFFTGLQYVDDLYTSVAINNEIITDYTLLNARISAQIHPTTILSLTGNNLLNQSYQINQGYPMPGINFLASIKFHLNKRKD